ncbi:MAG: mannose-1-phosphate guanylyltransferase/mannose-6-phosphate isomerase, partial [Desulfuromonas sp.]
MILPVILSGGAGTRLWPLSRELYPKQLLPLVGERTMLQDTVLRLDGIAELEDAVVVCNEEHRFMVAEQLRAINKIPSAIILEPIGRNTAPAVAVAAMQAMRDGKDPILLVLPADHVIKNKDVFQKIVSAGSRLVKDHLVTFGVVPDLPETGYGYIKSGIGLEDGGFEVERFVEKPDLATAESYLADGNYLWNSGMFMFRASLYLHQLEKFNPEMIDACRNAFTSITADLDFFRLEKESFSACPKDSIDYAVMEKTDMAAVIPLDAGWSDVGSWSSLWEANEQDAKGNVVQGDVFIDDSEGCLVHAESRLVATVGLKDHVVVETADAVLV